MRLEPLYRLRFSYPEGWEVELEGGWQQHYYRAEGACEGTLTGRFHASNYPLRRTVDGPFEPDMRGVIETEDGAAIMFECHGYGRVHPIGKRQIVGTVLHLSDDPRYRRLNDVVCVCVGEVRAGAESQEPVVGLVLDVAELIWEPISE
ncbi:DUF3237 family protein [Microbacterium sp. SS28]|uniref:DUF3237 family protein n=1 Tax=Microbacterium sp. SS28 TaxID=2919948 RepID=UPI001FA9BD74|nr:DUF3237 family protein [Microbacterium sp. SS28]